MRKTSVYLDEEEAEALRRLSTETGRSQAALIREAVRRVVARPPKRTFHSMGRGSSSPGPARWDSDRLYDKVFGRG